VLSPYLSDRSLTQGIRPNISHPSLGSLPEAGIGLGDCWSTVRAHGRLILALIVAALTLTGLAVLMATPNYTAYVILRIDPEAPKILDITQLQVQNSEDHDYYKTEFELLSSEELAANVIQDLNLQTQPLFKSDASKKNLLTRLDDSLASLIARLTGAHSATLPTSTFLGTSKSLIDKYLGRISVEPVTNTRLVRVSFRSPDPSLSAKIANTHVKDFLLLNQTLRRQAGEGARSFLEQELGEIKSKVEKSEANLNDYRTRKGILAFGTGDQEKNHIAEQRMEELTEELTDAQNQRIKAQAQLATLRAGDFDSVPAVLSNPMIESLRPEYDRLQAQYAELRSRYTDKYPPVGEAKTKLDATKKRLNLEAISIARAVERTYSTTLTREKQLEKQVAQEKQADIQLNDISLQDAVLVREVETNRQLYHDVLQRMHELSVESDAPMPNISIVESAQIPPYPSSPKKLKSLAIAGLLAVVIGIGLSFVIEQSNDCLKSVEEIEHYLHLPELGIVPDFGKLNNRRYASVPSLTAALYHSAHARRGGTPMMEPSSGWTSPGASLERRMKFYKSIRTAILYSRAGGAPKTILFASALPGEGKTMTAVSTALAFAQTGASTLLVDTDLRAPRCHTMLDADNLVGLSDIIVNRAQATRAIRRMDAWHLDDYQGLYLLGAGPTVPNPSELLTSVKMHQLLQQLGESYQFILLDSAPIMFSSETVGLATMVDGVVVVAGITTPKQVIRSICRRLTAAGATVYGIVLNKVDIRQTAYHKLDPYYAAKPTQHERPIDEALTV
jgi:succinoglycan biosynthesis transport protein ExoP